MGVTESLQVYGTEMNNNLKILNRHSIFYQNNTYYKKQPIVHKKNKIKHTKIEIPKFCFVALSNNPSNLHKEKKNKSENKRQRTTRHPETTNPHPFGALIDDYIH